MSTMPNPPARKRCFAPVVDARTRLLVLGSLPGTFVKESLVVPVAYSYIRFPPLSS